ncbi:DNA-binding protein [Microcoleus sp. LEGE 07076]|uniref:helix-turn-helix domain-containing transcriptional regulator n=1 Tax=Microcoleus sp. LEGE 07076 TaxID=915322 RepID=UPI001D1355D8|nr:transcriptional regulator [Microcoleus sp. LEGE 07076]
MMMSRSISYQEELIESLKDPLEVAPDIEACLEEENSEVLKLALNDVVEARHRMNQLSEDVTALLEKLGELLSEKKGSEIYCLSALLDALGFQLTVTVKQETS